MLNGCEEAIADWFTGILFNMTIIAMLSMTGLWMLGIPLAFANGLLAGLLAFIPNLGSFISVVPAAAIALLDAPGKAIAVVVLYIAIQQIESNILTPLVMKKQVSLLPAITLLSQVIFAAFFGFLGLLLALPLTLIIQQWLDEFWVRGFLDQHWLDCLCHKIRFKDSLPKTLSDKQSTSLPSTASLTPPKTIEAALACDRAAQGDFGEDVCLNYFRRGVADYPIVNYSQQPKGSVSSAH